MSPLSSFVKRRKGKKKDVPNYWKIYWLNFTSHKLDILYKKKKRRPYFEEKMWVKHRDNLINIRLKYLYYYTQSDVEWLESLV